MPFRRIAAGVGLVAVLALSIPFAASAVTWGTLTVYDDGTVRGQASGTTTISGASNAKVRASYSGSAARPTRIESYSLWWKPRTGNSDVYSWQSGAAAYSPTRSSTSRTSIDQYFALQTTADRVRVNTKLCVPKPWGTPVPCSAWAIATLDY